MFPSNRTRLQKVDISAPSVGLPQQRVCLNALAQIPVVRLRSVRDMMHITMPKVALWQYLWLEATTLIDCEFQDFTTFGQVCLRYFASACATSQHLRMADAAFL